MKLEIKDLHASVEGKEILKGVDLVINQGETRSMNVARLAPSAAIC